MVQCRSIPPQPRLGPCFLVLVLVGCVESGQSSLTDAGGPVDGEVRLDVSPPDAERVPDMLASDMADIRPVDGGAREDLGLDAAMQGSNLVVDPGFESGSPAWNIWGGAARVDGEAYAGLWAIRATNGNGAEQRIEGLDPNTRYRLSGWARTAGAEPITIGVKHHGNAEQRIAFAEPTYAFGELTFTTGFGATSAVIYAYKHRGDAPGYADGLSLVEVGPSDRELLWADEFDGSGALDQDRWAFEEGFVRNEELQWYQPENAFREDGYLVIEGRRADRANPDHEPGSDDWRRRRATIDYTSSSVTTRNRFEWQYGRLVVRAKVSNLTGTWPAIWTLGVRCEWPSNGEVDVMENYGGGILANFAWGTDRRWQAEWDSSTHPVADFEPGWTDRFHIWELDWTTEEMTILLDGRVLNTIALDNTVNGSSACAGENPFRQSHYLLLNLALGGAGGSVEALPFPTRYLVDYVRVYR